MNVFRKRRTELDTTAAGGATTDERRRVVSPAAGLDDLHCEVVGVRDELDLELDQVDPEFIANLRKALAQLTEVPADLGTRTASSVVEQLTEQSFLGALSDLCSVGWLTIGVLVGPSDQRSDGRDRTAHPKETSR